MLSELSIRVLSGNIKHLRAGKGYSQKKLGNLIGVTQQAICSWEQGRTAPSHDDLIRLADLFGVTIDALVGKNGIDKDTTEFSQFGTVFKIPLLRVIPPFIELGQLEKESDRIDIPSYFTKNNTKDYFVMQMNNNTMTGERINMGDLILVHKQNQVETEDIAVIRLKKENATLRHIYKTKDKTLLVSRGQVLDIAEVDSSTIEIIGKVVWVMFSL